MYVALTTSPARHHPDIAPIMQVIKSLRAIIGFSEIIHIYCDGIPFWVPTPKRRDYLKYLSNLERGEVGRLIRYNSLQGMPAILHRIAEDAGENLILKWEHDKLVLRPEDIDLKYLSKCMEDRRGLIQYVQFKPTPVEDSLEFPRPFGLPLTPSLGWTDGPHIATASHYKSFVCNYLPPTSETYEHLRKAPETRLNRAYLRTIDLYGDRLCHDIWRCYYYGNSGDNPYIEDIGKDTRRWRESLLGRKKHSRIKESRESIS